VCQGDVRSLHELFRSGEASVIDHDGDGFGLLIVSISPPVDQQPRSLLLSKYAAINGHVELCKFLLREGADPNESDGWYENLSRVGRWGHSQMHLTSP
jgi:hypothetical protein